MLSWSPAWASSAFNSHTDLFASSPASSGWTQKSMAFQSLPKRDHWSLLLVPFLWWFSGTHPCCILELDQVVPARQCISSTPPHLQQSPTQGSTPGRCPLHHSSLVEAWRLSDKAGHPSSTLPPPLVWSEQPGNSLPGCSHLKWGRLHLLLSAASSEVAVATSSFECASWTSWTVAAWNGCRFLLHPCLLLGLIFHLLKATADLNFWHVSKEAPEGKAEMCSHTLSPGKPWR